MIEMLIGTKLQNSAAGNTAASGGKQVDSKKHESFHHALAASAGPQPLNKHSPCEQARCELKGGRLVKRDAECDGAKDKDTLPQAAGDAEPLAATSSSLPEPAANFGNNQDLFQFALTTTSGNLSGSTAAKEGPQSINVLPDERRLESTGRILDKAVFLSSSAKAGHSAQQRMVGMETMRRGDAVSAPAILDPAQENKKIEGSGDLVPFAFQHTSSNGVSADTKILPTAPFGQGFAGNAALNSREKLSESDAAKSYSPNVAEVLSKGFHLAANSRTLRLQIDDPELGNISARIGNGIDGVSVTLTSKDQDSLIAVSELQRDMKIWLDQTNIDTSDRGELTGAGLQTPNGSERQQPDRRHGNQGNVDGPVKPGSIAFSDRDGAALAAPDTARQTMKRWRHI